MSDVQKEIDRLRADRGKRLEDVIHKAGDQTGEVWIAMAILFAGCFIAESLDRVALMASSRSKQE